MSRICPVIMIKHFTLFLICARMFHYAVLCGSNSNSYTVYRKLGMRIHMYDAIDRREKIHACALRFKVGSCKRARL